MFAYGPWWSNDILSHYLVIQALSREQGEDIGEQLRHESACVPRRLIRALAVQLEKNRHA